MRRRLVGMIGSLAVVMTSVAGVSPTASAAEASRVSGADRYETAVEVARRVGGGTLSGLDRIIVVTGENFPDSLAASGLAGYLDRCPTSTDVCGRTAILLTRAASLPDATRDAIRSSALPVSRILVLGGTDVVSESVHAQIAEAAGWNATGTNPVIRIAGPTRYETATAIVDYVRQLAGTALPTSYRTVLVASGEKFPDALAAGSIAYANGHLIVLSRAPEAPVTSIEAVEDLQATCAIVIGGTAALSERVATQVNSALTPGGCGIDRIGGANRYETAANIATRFVTTNGAGTGVLITSGENFADALTIGPLNGTDTPTILTAPDALPEPTQDWLRDNPSNAQNIEVIGGPSVIPPSVVDDAVRLVTPPAPLPPPPPPPPPPGVSFWPNNVSSQGGGDGITITATSATTSGEAFVVGAFSDTATFAGATTGSALTSAGANDVFVGKVTAAGGWEWAVRAGGTDADSATSVAMSSDGSAFVTGVFKTSATFGSITLTGGDRTVFVAKISPTGTWEWAAKAGTFSNVFSVSVDATGSAIVAGIKATENPFVLTDGTGSGSLSETWGGNRIPFVAKIDTTGVWQWATRVDSTTDQSDARGVSVLADGSAIVTGHFQGTATFGAQTPIALTSAGARDVFVAKIDTSGTWQWATQAGGAATESATSVSTLADGSGAIVSGFFEGTATFSTANPGATLTSAGGTDSFVAKIDTSGAWQWATQAGGSGNDEARSVSVDGSRAIVTGFFQGGATFSAANPGATLTSAGSTDAFVAEIDTSGTWQWAVGAGGIGADDGAGVSALADGTAIVGGSMTGTATFGSASIVGRDNRSAFVTRVGPTGTSWATGATAPGTNVGAGITGTATATLADGSVLVTGVVNQTATFTNTATGIPITVSSAGGANVYVARLDKDGRYVWVTTGGGLGNDQAAGISVLADGSGAIVTGFFEGTASFTGANPGATLTSAGSTDVFVAEIDTSGAWQWATQAGGTGTESATSVATLADGSGAIVTGFFQSTATFGTATRSPLTTGGGTDAFVAKIDGSGTWQWATRVDSGTGQSSARAVSVLNDGSAIVTGFLQGSATFSAQTPVVLFSPEDRDAFVAMIDSSGTWQWAAAVGGTDRYDAFSVSTVADGSGAIVTGSFTGTATFSGANPPPALTSAGGTDVFVAEIDTSGAWQWATQAGGTGNDDGTGVSTVTDGSGAIVTGSFTSTATFAGANPGATLTSAGGTDAFVAKIDGAGAWQWARAAGGTGNDQGTAVASFTDASAVVTGNHVGDASFGDYTLRGLANSGAFFAKVGADGSFVGSEPGSLLPSFDLSINGIVEAAVAQSDGKVLIGGSFTSVGGVARNRIARLNADGTLDTGFDPNASNTVYAIAVQADGKILVGGDFTSVGGATRNRIARLNADGTADTGFDANLDGGRSVYAIALDSTGRIVIGGSFESFNSGVELRYRVARLAAGNGALDATFDARNIPGTVYAVAVDAQDNVIIGGTFSQVGTDTRNNFAVLDVATGAPTSFNRSVNGGEVRAIAVQNDGKILIGGSFLNVNGTSRQGLARLDLASNSLDTTLGDVRASGGMIAVRSVTVLSNGKILIGGEFSSVSFTTRARLARLNANGTVDTAFPSIPFLGRGLHAVAVPTAGKIVIAGSFSSVQSQTRSNLAMLNG